MIRSPPRLPRPASPHRSFRMPPDSGMTAPASGSFARAVCSLRYSSSDRYSPTRRVKSRVSMNVNTCTTIRQRRSAVQDGPAARRRPDRRRGGTRRSLEERARGASREVPFPPPPEAAGGDLAAPAPADVGEVTSASVLRHVGGTYQLAATVNRHVAVEGDRHLRRPHEKDGGVGDVAARIDLGEDREKDRLRDLPDDHEVQEAIVRASGAIFIPPPKRGRLAATTNIAFPSKVPPSYSTRIPGGLKVARM